MTQNFIQKTPFIEAIKCHKILLLVLKRELYLEGIILSPKQTLKDFSKFNRAVRIIKPNVQLNLIQNCWSYLGFDIFTYVSNKQFVVKLLKKHTNTHFQESSFTNSS